MKKNNNYKFWNKGSKISKKDNKFIQKHIRILKFTNKEKNDTKYCVCNYNPEKRAWNVFMCYKTKKEAQLNFENVAMMSSMQYKSKLKSNELKKGK